MSRTTQPSAFRPLAGAGLLIAAAMAAPAASHAQTSSDHAQTSSEAALLNRLAPTVFIPSGFALGSRPALPIPPGTVNGERALLAPTAIIHEHLPAAVPAEAPLVSGEWRRRPARQIEPARRQAADHS
jgi:hypothetical protein